MMRTSVYIAKSQTLFSTPSLNAVLMYFLSIAIRKVIQNNHKHLQLDWVHF